VQHSPFCSLYFHFLFGFGFGVHHLFCHLMLYRYSKMVKQSLYRPGQHLMFQKVEAPRFEDARHLKLVKL